MDAYAFALALGAAGLVAMTILGFQHGHTGGHHTGGHHGGGHHGGGHSGPTHGHVGHQHSHQTAGSRWSLFLSPRIWFSLLVGFGATGLLLQQHLSGPVTLAVALLGAIVFEIALVRPIWSLASRFASEPALTLETGIMDDAVAVTGFNRD